MAGMGERYVTANPSPVRRRGDAEVETKARMEAPAARTPAPAQSSVSTGLFTVLFIALETGKQLCIYGAQYYNRGVPPVRPALNVAVVEAIKLLVALFLFAQESRFSRQPNLTPVFAIPALVYGINNNIFFLALNYTTTPVWNVLIQLRIVATAVLYRIVFSRRLSLEKWGSLGLLMAGVMLSQMAPGVGFVVGYATVSLAAIAVALNAFVSIYTEYLLKTHRAGFYEQQVAMYLYGLLASATYYVGQGVAETDIVWHASQRVWLLQIAGMALNALSGLAVAVIVRRLDNIAKLFAVAVALALQGVASAYLFPDRFNLTTNFLVAVGLIFYANYLYQR